MENKRHKSKMTSGVLAEARGCTEMPLVEVQNSIRKCRSEGEANGFSTSIFKLSRLFQKWTRDLNFCEITLSMGENLLLKDI